jgi:hypothetical protein
MKRSVGHSVPEFTEKNLEDSLFHYTTASGLVGILQKNELWFTAAHCLNDESELDIGQKLLREELVKTTHELIKARDPRIEVFNQRGMDIFDSKLPQTFADMFFSQLFEKITVFISCLCSATNRADFEHGLLSQWRGYGPDGGYAIQFSKRKLIAQIGKMNGTTTPTFMRVNYDPESELRKKLEHHLSPFLASYQDFLTTLAQPVEKLWVGAVDTNSLKHLTLESLSALMDYLVYTKSHHFSEEREWRLAQHRTLSLDEDKKTVSFLVRNGLIVPYVKTDPARFNVVSCIEGIIVGPNSRMDARLASTSQVVSTIGAKIPIRPSGIPFTRA